MNGLPYYKAYPRDFVEGTVGMRFELKGAYRLVLDLIYMQGGNLPDDARYISGLLGCSVRKWNSMRDELLAMGKLSVNGEFLTNYRAIIELESLRKLAEKQAENARGPRKIKDLEKPRLSHTEPDTDTDTEKKEKNPPTPRKRVEVSDQDFERFWSAYPRKVAKPAALKAWRKAVKREKPERIIAAAPKAGDGGQFTPHPATWLNADRWNDQPVRRNDPDDYLAMLGIRDHDTGGGNDTGGNFSRDWRPPSMGRGYRPDDMPRVQPAPAQEAGSVFEFEAVR